MGQTEIDYRPPNAYQLTKEGHAQMGPDDLGQLLCFLSQGPKTAADIDAGLRETEESVDPGWESARQQCRSMRPRLSDLLVVLVELGWAELLVPRCNEPLRRVLPVLR